LSGAPGCVTWELILDGYSESSYSATPRFAAARLPWFSHGQDIRHILRAFSLLRPGGVLVAVCLNGPRQQEKLLPFSDVREELPRGTFAYTDVPTMIIRLRA
ncbi:hypothetical protein ACKWPK_25105, partial [Escherichia coli]